MTDYVLAQAPDWITPDQWPYRIELPAESAARLMVVEERGTNLRLVLPDGSQAWVPERRHTGIELLLVPAGESITIELEQRYANSPATSFRMVTHQLSTETELEAGRAFVRAGVLAGDGTAVALQQACIEYEVLADRTALPRAWTDTAKLLAVSCNASAGRNNTEARLNQLDEINVTLGVPLYHKDWLLGRHHYLNGRFERAQQYYEHSLQDLELSLLASEKERNALEQDRADLMNDLAIIFVVRAYRATGAERVALIDRARALFESSLEIATEHQNHLVLANIYYYIAQLHLVEANDQGLIENLLSARREAELLDDPDELIFILGSIGDYYTKWGQFRRALNAYLEVVRILETSSWLGRSGDSFQNLASLYHALGDLPRAKELTERAIALYESNGNAYRTHILNYELGTILEEQGDLAAAKALLEKHIEYSNTRETPWDPVRMRSQAALSRVENKLGNQARALTLSTEIFDHEDILANSSSPQAIPIYVNHAALLHATGDSTKAEAIFEYALKNIAEQPTDKVEILANKLKVYQQQGLTDQAIATAKQAFDLIESQQTQLESARLGPYWSAKTYAVYAAHADYLLEHQRENPEFRELAFTVAERARATSLRMRRQEMLLAGTENNPAVELEWRQLMLETQRGFTTNRSDVDTLALERRIIEARERYFVSQGDRRENLLQSPLSLAEIVQNIPIGTILLEFVAGPTNFWRYEITRNGWNITNLGQTARMQTLVDAALYELQQPNRGRQNFQLLSESLLQGLSFHSDQRHLLISPTAELNTIPFSALMYEGDYLGERTTVTLIPSSGEYFSQAPLATPKEHSREIAVFANPVFGTFTEPMPMANNGEVFRGWTSSLRPLPATAQEAKALESFYTERERLILTGAAATTHNFFSSDVRNARIIHLATHGYFNEQLPELVGFVLSEDSSSDGFVSMAEISAEYFNADLVVISACSTAQGEILPGEGAMSLGRAFLAQGVNSVISTLWPVSDRATAIFMKEFYRALNEQGASYAEALQQAQQALRQSPTYRAPLYWSAYTLTTANITPIAP